MDDVEEKLLTAVREIRERVRTRYPNGTAGATPVPLADLMPIVRARDKAEAKVAAIGTVNPRPPGVVNNLVQWFKGIVARSLDWHVREQVEFNRSAMDCVETALAAMNEFNRGLGALAAHFDHRVEELRGEIASLSTHFDQRIEELRREMIPLAEGARELKDEARELKDVRTHWIEWRREWERKLSINEMQFLRGLADLQTAFQHRATLMESNFRDLTGSQHRDFTSALDRARLDIQQRLWADVEKARAEYERLIHNELRVVRQRASAVTPEPPSAPAAGSPQEAPAIDYLRFAERFRGTEEHVREGQRRYVSRFEGCAEVLDLGCGRGEFLEVMRDAGAQAHGIELSRELVDICRAKGLRAEFADMFAYLDSLEEGSLDGVFCAQVVEHLLPAQLPELVRLAAAKIRPGGRIVIETPNPECLAIFASHFYIDPTHVRPAPAPLLVFYLEESGFGRIEVEPVNMAADSMPSVESLPDDFRKAFFGGLDYSVSAIRL